MPSNFSFLIEGRLAGSACPGMWEDLGEELLAFRDEGIGAIVSLTSEPLETELIDLAGIRYLHLPIVDFTPPSQEQIREFVRFVDEFCGQSSRAVLVHCAAGMGRTGTMLAAYLVSTGMGSAEAIRTVRRSRPGSIETRDQERAVAEYARSLGRE